MKAKILVVDDEVDVLRLVGYALENQGYGIVTADTGKEALAKVAAEQPDLVILDRMLPDMSGTEVCVRLRGQPWTRDLPILMLSARALVADRISGLQAGADDYVTKPFELDEIVTRVAGLLRRRASQVGTASPSEMGRVIAVWGAKAGVGQTVIAVNLAVAIHGLTGKRVALVDANVQQGDVSLMLDIDPSHNLRDLVLRVDEMDSELVQRAIVEHASGIHVLAAPPPGTDGITVIETDAFARVLSYVRMAFDYVVVDGWPSCGRCDPKVVERAGMTLLITTSEVTSLRRARQFIELAQSLDDASATLHLILNPT